MSKSFINSMLRNKTEEEFFFPAIIQERLKESEKKRLTHKWTGRFSPSGLTLSMCPYQFVYVEAHKRSPDNIDGLHRMGLGRALHELISKEAQSIEGLLWEFPNVPKKDRTKFSKTYPEIYFFDEEMNISGRADLILKMDNEPVLIDLKFSQRDLSSPLESHITQVMVGIYSVNRLKYYSKPIRKGGILYQNPITGQSREFYLKYEEYKDQIEDLVWHLNSERTKFLEGKESMCSYSRCKEHTR